MLLNHTIFKLKNIPYVLFAVVLCFIAWLWFVSQNCEEYIILVSFKKNEVLFHNSFQKRVYLSRLYLNAFHYTSFGAGTACKEHQNKHWQGRFETKHLLNKQTRLEHFKYFLKKSKVSLET